MTYVTGLGQVVKGNRQEIYFDKNAFIFATDFATNTYFADDLNWSKVALYFTDATQNQKHVIILMDDGSRGWFAPSVTARTGDWSLEKIEIFDKDEDFFPVYKPDIPNADQIKAKVIRVVAPASPVSIHAEPGRLNISASDASNWKSGFKFKLWSAGDNAYLSEDIYEIISIENDVITLDKPIAVDATGKTLVMRFPNFSNVSGEQAAKYEYVGVGY